MPSTGSQSPDSQPSKRQKRSHDSAVAPETSAVEHTPPPSPRSHSNARVFDIKCPPKVDLEGVNDDIVEGVITQLEATGNRPHLVKELALVLSLKLTSVQQSANPCAIISSRLVSYLKRPCWSAKAPCPLAKELEPVHPRRTYYFLTTYPHQPLPTETLTLQTAQAAIVTPSVSLTDDSGSDDIESRRRELSPSPEVDLLPPEFDDMMDGISLPATPHGSSKRRFVARDPRRDSPPLEKDEREFTQTADVLQKRKLSDALAPPAALERHNSTDFTYRDDSWYMDTRSTVPSAFLTSPAMKPSMSSHKKEEEGIHWLKLNSLIEWDKGAESIEIDELDCLFDTY
jgi:hypothetical protein